VYESTPPGWRLSAHRRVTAALEENGAPLIAQAHHVACSARPGDEEAIALLADAARSVLPKAPASAAEWVATALELVPEGPAGDARRLELLVLRATACASLGDAISVHDTLLRAIDLAEEGSALWILLVENCVIFETTRGDIESATERATRALTAVGPERPGTEMLRLGLATCHMFSLRFEDALHEVHAVLEDPDALSPVVRAGASTALAMVLAASEDFANAGPAATEAAVQIDNLSDADLVVRPEATWALARAERLLERYPDSIRHLDRCLRLCRASGQGRPLGTFEGELASNLIVCGRLAEAAEALDRLESIAALGGTWSESSLFVNRARLLQATGHLDAAWALMERGLAVSDHEGNPEAPRIRRSAARLALDRGDVRRAFRLAQPPGAKDIATVLAGRVEACELMVDLSLASDELEQAREWSEEALRRAAENGLPLSGSRARRCAASVLMAWRDNWDVAARLAGEGAALAENAGARIEAARCREVAAAALVKDGFPDKAVEELRAAESVFAMCGADRDQARATNSLRSLGHRVRRSRPDAKSAVGQEALSARERELGELVASGKTNRQIASALFISERTVEAHLRNVFRKLGVANRAAVAAAISRSSNPPSG